MKLIIFLFLLIVGSYSLEYKLYGQWYNSKDYNHSILPSSIFNKIEGYKIINSEIVYGCESFSDAHSWIALGQISCDDFKNYEFICDEKDDTYHNFHCHFDESKNMEIIMFTNRYDIIFNDTGEYIKMNTISIEYHYSAIGIWLSLFIAYCLKLFVIFVELITYCMVPKKINIFYNIYILFFWIILHFIELILLYLIIFGTVILFWNIKWITIVVGIFCCLTTLFISPPLMALCIYIFSQIISPKNQYTMIIN
jgi:hypothetical protein